jgi:hypothetical protein
VGACRAVMEVGRCGWGSVSRSASGAWGWRASLPGAPGGCRCAGRWGHVVRWLSCGVARGVRCRSPCPALGAARLGARHPGGGPTSQAGRPWAARLPTGSGRGGCHLGAGTRRVAGVAGHGPRSKARRAAAMAAFGFLTGALADHADEGAAGRATDLPGAAANRGDPVAAEEEIRHRPSRVSPPFLTGSDPTRGFCGGRPAGNRAGVLTVRERARRVGWHDQVRVDSRTGQPPRWSGRLTGVTPGVRRGGGSVPP